MWTLQAILFFNIIILYQNHTIVFFVCQVKKIKAVKAFYVCFFLALITIIIISQLYIGVNVIFFSQFFSRVYVSFFSKILAKEQENNIIGYKKRERNLECGNRNSIQSCRQQELFVRRNQGSFAELAKQRRRTILELSGVPVLQNSKMRIC